MKHRVTYPLTARPVKPMSAAVIVCSSPIPQCLLSMKELEIFSQFCFRNPFANDLGKQFSESKSTFVRLFSAQYSMKSWSKSTLRKGENPAKSTHEIVKTLYGHRGNSRFLWHSQYLFGRSRVLSSCCAYNGYY